MAKKKKLIIDIETVGLHGPGMLRDMDIRNAINVVEVIKEQLDDEAIRVRGKLGIPSSYFDINFIDFRPSGNSPKTIDLMKFVDDFNEGVHVIPHNTNHNVRTIYNEEDIYKGAMHNKSSDDFINGETLHQLWGSQPGDKEFYEHNDGDYCWVKVLEDDAWDMGQVKLFNMYNKKVPHFTFRAQVPQPCNEVYDYTLIEKPE